MAKQLMCVSEYRETFFVGDKKPDVSTIKRWITKGQLKGEKIGNMWFVDISTPEPDNDLINRVLRKTRSTNVKKRT